MPRFAPIALAVALVVGGCALAPTDGPTTVPTSASAAASLAAAASFGPTTTLQPAGHTVEGDVAKVVDGDTIDVEINRERYRVRYIGIDAPETVKPSTPVQWMGPEASAANKQLVNGKHVVLEKDVSETDKYGRLLRYVWLHEGGTWTMVNLRLVALGYAAAVSYPPDVHWQHLLLDAQTKARSAGAGLWGPQPAESR
jgi:endonuclease YncB( thermonuclease family)